MVGSDTTDDSTGNAILGNSIYANAELGIDLGDESSPTGTPTGTTPSGPNDLQNAPVLSAATGGGSSTTISGTPRAEPNTTFRIEFFANPAGTGQGQTYLGFLDVTTNGSGSASFSFSPASPVAAGLNITATATDPNGNTSEFSASATVQTAPVNVTSDLSVKSGGFVYNRTTRQFTQTMTITNISGAAIVGPIELVLLNLKNATLVQPDRHLPGQPLHHRAEQRLAGRRPEPDLHAGLRRPDTRDDHVHFRVPGWADSLRRLKPKSPKRIRAAR